MLVFTFSTAVSKEMVEVPEIKRDETTLPVKETSNDEDSSSNKEPAKTEENIKTVGGVSVSSDEDLVAPEEVKE